MHFLKKFITIKRLSEDPPGFSLRLTTRRLSEANIVLLSLPPFLCLVGAVFFVFMPTNK